MEIGLRPLTCYAETEQILKSLLSLVKEEPEKHCDLVLALLSACPKKYLAYYKCLLHFYREEVSVIYSSHGVLPLYLCIKKKRSRLLMDMALQNITLCVASQQFEVASTILDYIVLPSLRRVDGKLAENMAPIILAQLVPLLPKLKNMESSIPIYIMPPHHHLVISLMKVGRVTINFNHF